MMTDAFWWLATSNVGLGAVGALALIAGIVSLLPASLIARVYPQGAALVYLARPVMGAALLLLGIGIGHRLADERQALANAKQELAVANNQLEQQKATTAEKQRLANLNRERADELQTKVSDYESQLAAAPTSAACMLNDSDIRSLRTLGERGKARNSNPGGLRRFGRNG